jgi:myo-inositol-hexaphosphate 3-phosphohydrolase
LNSNHIATRIAADKKLKINLRPVFQLVQVHFLEIQELEVYGSCAFSLPHANNHTAYDHWIALPTKQGVMHLYTFTRTEVLNSVKLHYQFKVRVGLGSQLENCIANPATRSIYVGEESVGVWGFKLDDLIQAHDRPHQSLDSFNQSPLNIKQLPMQLPLDQVMKAGRMVDNNVMVSGWLVAGTPQVHPLGELHQDIEGLAIYAGPTSTKLLVSSQGSNSFFIYDITQGSPTAGSPRREKLGRFGVGKSAGSDAVTKTDSLAVASNVKSTKYPKGVMVLHDDATTIERHGNRTFPYAEELKEVLVQGRSDATFKVVDWAELEKAMNLPAN